MDEKAIRAAALQAAAMMYAAKDHVIDSDHREHSIVATAKRFAQFIETGDLARARPAPSSRAPID